MLAMQAPVAAPVAPVLPDYTGEVVDAAVPGGAGDAGIT